MTSVAQTLTNYPPTHITSADEVINVLQLTDLHLYETLHQPINGERGERGFESLLSQALSDPIRCDLILLTGDLVSEVKTSIYDRIFERMAKTDRPFACIAGNHDVTDELDKDKPFYQRTLVAHAPDERLLNQHVIHTPSWQILLINSAVAGRVGGHVSQCNLDWIQQQLEQCDKPTMIALHHHIFEMQSQWIDAHMTDNASALWQLLMPYPQVKVVICGHTHQENSYKQEHITAYTTPSTCYQFKPLENDFAVDTEAKPGYRWLQLHNNGEVASWVKRLDT